MNYLIVVDVQAEFYNSESAKFNRAIENKIKEAKKKRHKIIFVEYKGCSASNQNLYDTLGSYKRFHKVTKDRNDGSGALIKRLKLKANHTTNIKLCGMYTDYCVYETFEGLHNKLPNAKFEILADACRSVDGYDRSKIFRNFTRTKIIKNKKINNTAKVGLGFTPLISVFGIEKENKRRKQYNKKISKDA